MSETGRDWIIDDRIGSCGQCRSEYRSLSQHWTKARDCDHRPLSDHQHETVRGLLLGDGSLGGRESPNLRVESVRGAHIEWLHGELGWLSRGVSRYHKDGAWVYRLQTMSHPELGEYLSWRSAPPASGWRLTRQAARVCTPAMGRCRRRDATAEPPKSRSRRWTRGNVTRSWLPSTGRASQCPRGGVASVSRQRRSVSGWNG
jgi:hypothetical protein